MYEENWPERGARYWYITTDGSVDFAVWENAEYNMADLLIGNVFSDPEDALYAFNRLRVLAEMRRFAFEPDWGNPLEEKWGLVWRDTSGVVPLRVEFPTGCPVFPSAGQALACACFVTDERLERFWFRTGSGKMEAHDGTVSEAAAQVTGAAENEPESSGRAVRTEQKYHCPL